MTELFYCIEVKTNYENLIIKYNSLIDTYREIISNNENYYNKINGCHTMMVDNTLFQNIISDYLRTLSGLQSYIFVLNNRIRELDPKKIDVVDTTMNSNIL